MYVNQILTDLKGNAQFLDKIRIFLPTCKGDRTDEGLQYIDGRLK